jgi:hypothetical protein
VESVKLGVCVATGVMGVFIGSIGRFPRVGSGVCVEVEGRAATTLAGQLPSSHVPPQQFWNIPLTPSFTLPTSFRTFHGKVGSAGRPIDPLGLDLGPCLLLVLWRPVVSRLLVLDK